MMKLLSLVVVVSLVSVVMVVCFHPSSISYYFISLCCVFTIYIMLYLSDCLFVDYIYN